ncbi:MAG: putative repeat protein (TIGR02543 family), partial [Candidatus Marivariicella framensis]
MKKLLLLALLLIFSCSKDAGVAEPAPPVVVIPPTPQFDLVVSATEGGSVNPSGGTYDEDSSVTITATPIEGYEFTGWTGSNETSNVISITLSADITLTANFQLAETQF